MPKVSIINSLPDDLKGTAADVSDLVQAFAETYAPLEQTLHILADARTGARYLECHIRASKLVSLSTIDVPLDPDEQPDYRANREIAEDHFAFGRMKLDALARRTFSNIVTEFAESYNPEHPLKVIGGQHRYIAAQQALVQGVDEYHGVKVYFGLDPDQRLDVQVISNTNIAVSVDLMDRMYETVAGPQLRNWCQEVGLLLESQDFADRRARGEPITVRAARTFIINYFAGRAVDPKKFDHTRTTPVTAKTGGAVPEWDELRAKHPNLWTDSKLKEAGKEFALLAQAQRDHFINEKGKGLVNVDFAEKALNYAVLSAWAYVAGMLHNNKVRLDRHYALRQQKGKDPLNVAMLAKGRHKSDPENYRGLGYRTDPKERGRFVELFYEQAEKGEGITKGLIDLAIARYHAKQAILEVEEVESRL